MSSTSVLRAVIAAAAAVTPSAPGWNPGDTVIDDALGQLRQIGLSGGVKYLRADPLAAVSAAGFNQATLGTPQYAALGANKGRLFGTLARVNGQVPVGAHLVTAYLLNTGGGTFVPPIIAAVGAPVSAITNATGDLMTAVVLSDGAGNWSIEFAASAPGSATVYIASNVDVVGPISINF